MEIEASMEVLDLTTKIVTSIGHGFKISQEDEERAGKLGIDINNLKKVAGEMYNEEN